jgi:NOL1/NOP2/fmu family ribosome biogenesis protein
MFEHRRMSGAVLKFLDKNNPTPAEGELRKVINAFAQLQEDRYKADYDVGWIWSRTDVTNTLAIADEAFKTWRSIRNEVAAQHYLNVNVRGTTLRMNQPPAI